MAITVLPPIEEPNPFGELALAITENVLPLYTAYEINRTRIERLSDYNLSDLAEVLKLHAPEFLNPDGTINWNAVESYYTSGDPNKTKIAQFLINARRLRNDFASATLLEKLNMLDAVGSATSPEQLEKILTVSKTLDVVRNIIEKSDAPDEVKLWFAVNADVFYEKPEILSLVLKLFSPKEQKQQSEAPKPTEQQTPAQTAQPNVSQQTQKPAQSTRTVRQQRKQTKTVKRQTKAKQQPMNLLKIIEETKKDPMLRIVEQNQDKRKQKTQEKENAVINAIGSLSSFLGNLFFRPN